MARLSWPTLLGCQKFLQWASRGGNIDIKKRVRVPEECTRTRRRNARGGDKMAKIFKILPRSVLSKSGSASVWFDVISNNFAVCGDTFSSRDRLEQPNMVGGLPAAFLAKAEVSGKPCSLLVTYTDVDRSDSITMSGLREMFFKTCKM